MMRFYSVAIMLMCLAQPVKGSELGEIYKVCRAYVEAGFSHQAMGNDAWKGIACASYVGGVLDVTRTICAGSPDAYTRKIAGVDDGDIDTDAVIQSLVNFAAQNPQLWGESALFREWTSIPFPCKR